MKPATSRPGERGFALLIVLWAIGLLALIGTALAANGRLEAQRAANLRDEAVVEAAADGAVFQAILHIARGDWLAVGGQGYPIRIGQAVVQVRLEDESRKVNPNFASKAVLQSLLQGVGVNGARATSLAAAMVDWRTRSPRPQPGGAKTPQYLAAGLPYGPPGRPYGSLDEINLVLGMTPDVAARLKPYLSLYNDRVRTAPDLDPLAAQDPAEAGPPQGGGGGFTGVARARLMTVFATAYGPGHARFIREAVVRVNPQPEPGETPYEVLTWAAPGR